MKTSESSCYVHIYVVQFPLTLITAHLPRVLWCLVPPGLLKSPVSPRPPSPPPHTSPVTVGGAKPAAGSYSSPSTTHHSPQPPREDSVKCETTIVCVCVYNVLYVQCVCMCVCVCVCVRVFVESMYKENDKSYPLFLVFNYAK